MRLRPLALAASVLVAGALAAAPAAASTGGTPDGEQHPNVALIVGYADEDSDGDGVNDRFRCSATLVSEDVLLTAAHCTDGVVGKMLVTFDSVVAEEPPLPFPAAEDPSVGYTPEEVATFGDGYYTGTPHAHPEYSNFTDLDNWYDVGVVVLDKEPAVAPAEVAELNTLDAIKKSDLSKTRFTAVGYGTEFRKPEAGPQKKQPLTYPLIRRYVEMTGQKVTPQILQTQSSVNKPKGTGGTCFGDSGGPVFLDGQVVAVTSYGLNDNCGNISGYQRVDIAGVQEWLATFGVTS